MSVKKSGVRNSCEKGRPKLTYYNWIDRFEKLT